MAFLTYAYILAVLFVADSMQSEFQSCGNEPAPQSVKIVGCDELPCNLKRGTNVEVNIDFKAVEDTKSLRPLVDANVGGVHVPFPFPEQNACKGLLKGQCPLEKGEPVTYFLKMPIEKAYPKISLTIQFSLVDEHQKTQVCLRIPANVID